jgi:hypothetical protein
MKDHIDTILETATPRQTTVERERLFLRVMSEVGIPTEVASMVPSPYFFWRTYFTNTRVLVAAVLIVVLGTGGTVAAAESAKPGDVLFPIEQATEQLRLTLATAERRGELEARFLEKRFTEVSELLTEETFVASSTRERFISEAGESRIASAVAVLVNQIERVDDPSQAERLRYLLRSVEREGDRRIRIENTRFEVRTDTERIRIDDTDGNMRIRYDENDDSDDDSYKATPSRSSDGTSDDSDQRDDDEQDVENERDADEESDQKTSTAHEEEDREGDEDREDEKSGDNDDNEVDDNQERKEDDHKDHKGRTDDDQDR